MLSETGRDLSSQFNITWEEEDPQTLVFSGRALQQYYEDILAEIFFQNEEDELNTTTRVVTFWITDGRFNASAQTVVEIMPTNDPAVLNFTSKTLTYVEELRQPLNLFELSDVLIDSDGNMLEWLSIEINPSLDDMDVLAADAGDSGLTVSLITSDTGNMVLNISGYAHFLTYEGVLQTVTFVNDFPGMNLTQRVIEVTTFDGMTVSPSQTIFITIDPYDDPPQCFFGTRVSPARTCSFVSFPIVQYHSMILIPILWVS